MQFVVDSNVTLTQHLFVDGNCLHWVSDIPDDVYHFSGAIKLNSHRCLDTLFKLENVNVPIIDQRYQNVLQTLLPSSSLEAIPNKHFLHPEHHKNRLKGIVSTIQGNLHKVEKKYYESTWVPSTQIFERLQAAYIDENRWSSLMNDECGNRAVVKTFYPTHDIARKVEYDRFGTRTGRLTVSYGPNILTLKRDLRNILKSRYKYGSICYYDFNALEVRCILYENGVVCESDDVYNDINVKLFKGMLDRDVVKAIIISKMYGSDVDLSQRLNIDTCSLRQIEAQIIDYMGLLRLYEKTKADFVKHGYIRNKFGRRIEITEPLDHVIANSYVQSSGVDVSLLGFSSLTNGDVLPHNSIPLFLLHDALLLDVEDITKLQKVVWMKIDGFEQQFPLKLREII